MEDKRLACALILFLMMPSIGFSGTSFGSYPESEIVSEESLATNQTFELITGPVRRINSLLSPESKIFVTAKKRSRTLLSNTKRNAKEVYNYYLKALKSESEIIYQCNGRSCGPSTYWANIVYQKALIYGPEQYQHYLVARLNTSHPYYLVIYIGQRATGQVYIQQDELYLEVTESLMKSALTETGRFVLPQKLDEKWIEEIENIVVESQSQYLLVVHDKMKVGESFNQALKRTQTEALKLKDLFDRQQALSRLRFHGAGPVSPRVDEPAGRIELIKLQ